MYSVTNIGEFMGIKNIGSHIKRGRDLTVNPLATMTVLTTRSAKYIVITLNIYYQDSIKYSNCITISEFNDWSV